MQVIYCDYSRIILRDGNNQWDPTLESYVTNDDDFKKYSFTSGVGLSPLAITYPVKHPTDGDPPRVPANVIQFCPWFVELIKNKRFPDLEWPSLKNFAAN